jgi:predicted dehydrogenase
VTGLILENGIHVNVEKTMAATLIEAEKMVQLAKSKNLKLGVGHVERFNPVFQELKKRIQSPLFIEMQRLAPFKPRGSDVSVVHDLMIHDLDLLWNLVGGNSADDSILINSSIRAAGGVMRTSELDWCNSWFEFKSKEESSKAALRASINVSRVSEKAVRQIKVYEKNKFWIAHLGNLELECISMNADVNDPLRIEKIQIEKKDALQLETDAFVNAVLENGPLVVSGQDGLEALIQVESVVRAVSDYDKKNEHS